MHVGRTADARLSASALALVMRTDRLVLAFPTFRFTVFPTVAVPMLWGGFQKLGVIFGGAV